MKKAWLPSIIIIVALLCHPFFALADTAPLRITVSVPGPRNISYLPIDLIPRIGADKAEGAQIQLLHTGGGGVALSNLMNRNADFAVAGMPAAMSLRVNGGKVTVIAAVDDAPLFVLMVRADLKGQVRRIADLKGKVVGVNTSSLSSKTTSQQLAELVLKTDGVSTDMVRLMPAGQSWLEQSSILESKTADAIMGDEPFASRLLAENKVFFLANLADPKTSEKIPGANFLHAALETREETLTADPRLVAKMVAILRRTLQWVAAHTPEQIVDALDIADKEERAALIAGLKKYPNLYSKDGRLSARQLRETGLFFHGASEGNAAAQALKIEIMIADKWAGNKD
ncbi:MAG: ABC transporter substrate-binding protein [Sulfuricellaceae bacterium]